MRRTVASSERPVRVQQRNLDGVLGVVRVAEDADRRAVELTPVRSVVMLEPRPGVVALIHLSRQRCCHRDPIPGPRSGCTSCLEFVRAAGRAGRKRRRPGVPSICCADRCLSRGSIDLLRRSLPLPRPAFSLSGSCALRRRVLRGVVSVASLSPSVRKSRKLRAFQLTSGLPYRFGSGLFGLAPRRLPRGGVKQFRSQSSRCSRQARWDSGGSAVLEEWGQSEVQLSTPIGVPNPAGEGSI